jgi:hypothetical protein
VAVLRDLRDRFLEVAAPEAHLFRLMPVETYIRVPSAQAPNHRRLSEEKSIRIRSEAAPFPFSFLLFGNPMRDSLCRCC